MNITWDHCTPNQFIAFRMCQRVGMFATLTHCVLLCKYCFERQIKPIFLLENDLYGKTEWFGEFFTHRFPTTDKIPDKTVLIRNRFDINTVTRGCEQKEIHHELTTILEGALLFHFFIRVKPEIRGILAKYKDDILLGHRSIGVHYRGTDKRLGQESQFIPYESVLEVIERERHENDIIFLATDDSDFFDFASDRIPPSRLRYLRKPSGLSHIVEPSSNEKSLFVLADAWLLSQCDLLIKTPSLLSAWSKLFNIDLPVILVGRPTWYCGDQDKNLRSPGYFPENILHEGRMPSVRHVELSPQRFNIDSPS
jgi:hypothetical protein